MGTVLCNWSSKEVMDWAMGHGLPLASHTGAFALQCPRRRKQKPWLLSCMRRQRSAKPSTTQDSRSQDHTIFAAKVLPDSTICTSSMTSRQKHVPANTDTKLSGTGSGGLPRRRTVE